MIYKKKKKSVLNLINWSTKQQLTVASLVEILISGNVFFLRVFSVQPWKLFMGTALHEQAATSAWFSYYIKHDFVYVKGCHLDPARKAIH